MRKCFSIFYLLIILCLFFGLTHLQWVLADSSCQQQTVQVQISPLDPKSYTLVTWLCWKGNLSDKTVEVVLHGLTYDHNYWDFPYQNPQYSYVHSAVNAGYAVLNMDRIGSGESDHPLDTLVTLQSGAYVTHQVITALRSGVYHNTNFQKIVLVGHSAGSGIAILEASGYHDIDGLILTGYAHQLNPTVAPLLTEDFYPAILDSKFVESNYSPGYITTRPGVRNQLFYDTTNADSQVIALDESLKQAGTAEELAGLPNTLLPTVSLSLHIPVLIADGQFDKLLCGIDAPCDNAQVLLAREQPFFNSDTCLETYVLPNSGHDINLHLNSSEWYSETNNWIARRVGNFPTEATNPCL